MPPRRHARPDHVRLPPVLDGCDLRVVLQPTVGKPEAVDGAILLVVRKQHIWLCAHDLLLYGRVRTIRQVVRNQEGALRVAVDPYQVGVVAIVEGVIVVVDRGRNSEVVCARESLRHILRVDADVNFPVRGQVVYGSALVEYHHSLGLGVCQGTGVLILVRRRDEKGELRRIRGRFRRVDRLWLLASV